MKALTATETCSGLRDSGKAVELTCITTIKCVRSRHDKGPERRPPNGDIEAKYSDVLNGREQDNTKAGQDNHIGATGIGKVGVSHLDRSRPDQ